MRRDRAVVYDPPALRRLRFHLPEGRLRHQERSREVDRDARLPLVVGDVLDRIDQFEDFDPRKNYALTLGESELTREEREAQGAVSADDVELPL